jgi:hypothetical protein
MKQQALPLQLPPLGIRCPDCGSTESEVTRTVKRAGTIRRERRCLNPECRRLLLTTEQLGPGPRTGGVAR